jgi:nucleoside-diphosphate-sugar epimerase
MTSRAHFDQRGGQEGVGGRLCLVTGGAGFIGSHLCRALLERGEAVRVVDDFSSGRRERVDSRSDLIEGSILDEGVLARAMVGVEVVFHLAAMVSVPMSVSDPERCAKINIGGTQNVLEAARRAGVGRVIFASSAAVYGDQPVLPSQESHAPAPCSPYAASKAAGEMLLKAYCACYPMSGASLRYFNIFGEGQDSSSPYAAVVGRFAEALRTGAELTLYGDGRQTRDFTHVQNVVRANLLASDLSAPMRGEIFNIGTGVRTSLRELLGLMGEILGVTPRARPGPDRPGDVRDSVADVGVARAVLGYRPVVDLRDGLMRMLSQAGPGEAGEQGSASVGGVSVMGRTPTPGGREKP